MHRCLEIPEMLQLIINSLYHVPTLSELDIDPPTATDLSDFDHFPRGNADLRSLALTCRRFSEQCLDALWYYLPELGPLFSLLGLPADLMDDIDMNDDLDDYYSYARECLEQADYTRFNAYACRVVGLLLYDEHIMRDDIILNLIGISGRLPALLTPRLRLLIWLKGQATLSHMSMFCGPALQHLSGGLAMNSNEHYDQFNQHSYHTMLAHMRTLTLSLERLGFVAQDSDGEPDAMPLMLCFPSIKEFSHNFDIKPAAIAHVAQMRSLRRLQIRDTFVFPLPPHSVGEPPFPALQDIYLDGVPLEILIELLKSSQTPRELQSVEFLATHVFPDAALIGEFYRVLHTNCIPGKLTKLILGFTGPDHLRDSQSVRDVDCRLHDAGFLLLREFTHLSELHLSYPSGFWRPSVLEQAIPAWSRLRTLQLSGEGNQPVVRAQTLRVIAKHCPQLSTLGLNTNFDIMEPHDCQPQSHEPSDESRPKLHLSIREVPVGTHKAVATAFCAAFQNLHSVSWDPRVEFYVRQHWPQFAHMTEEMYVRELYPEWRPRFS